MMLEVALRHRRGEFALDVDFAATGVTAITGPSGAGKSTVVQAVAGLLRPDAGRIVLDGTTLTDTAAGTFVPPARRRVGVVFQEGRLFPHMSVRANLTYGGSDGLDAITDMLGIGHLLARRPATLSGGERQRVAIGRALLSRPRLLLMDEPLAALDPARKAEILPYLERVAASGTPILYVSHAEEEVARLAGRVVEMEQGRVRRVGLPRRIGTLIPGIVRREGLPALVATRIGHLRVETALPAGTPVNVRVPRRGTAILPTPQQAPNVLPGTVEEVEDGEVRVRIGPHLLPAPIDPIDARAMGLAPGAPCALALGGLSAERAPSDG